MKTIWKYPLQPTQRLPLPKGAKILSAQLQNDEICIWVLLDTENLTQEVPIWIFGTGHEVPKNLNLEFIGTVQLMGGGLVFHVFQEIV